MARDLSGTVVAVTGASSGIGEAIALRCAAAGAAVSLGARRADRLDALAARIREAGGTAVAIPMDVTREDEARTFVVRTREELGDVGVLVNNAGVMLLGRVAGAPVEEWRRMIEVNVLGLLYCTHAVLPVFRARGGGHVVNVSSVAGREARAGSAVYNLTKFGIGAFSEALRQECVRDGVRVTVVEPGHVDTELVSHNRPEVLERLRARGGEPPTLAPGDVATAVVYAIGQPATVSVNEILVRPSGQLL